MRKEEFFAIMTNIRSIYLNVFNNQTDDQFKGICANWYRFFENDSYEVVSKAVDRYIATDTKGFAPSVGQIKEMMVELQPLKQIDIGKAWEKVVKSGRCDYQMAKEQYDKLPTNIQKAVGSPMFLREIGYADSEALQFHRKDFEKRYEDILKNEKKDVASGLLSLQQVENNNTLPYAEDSLLKLEDKTGMKGFK